MIRAVSWRRAAAVTVLLAAGCAVPPTDEAYQAGLREFLAGRHASAERHFREFLAQHPPSPHASDAHYYLGSIALQRGTTHNAESHFRAALRAPRSREIEAGAALGLARCHFQRGAYRHCMAACRDLLDDRPASPRADEALFLYAEAADYEGLTAEARSYYRQVAERFPSGAWAPKAEARLTGAGAEPDASPAGKYSVQVAALASAARAAEHARLFRQRGYPAEVVVVTSGGRTLHAVRIGPYATRADAEGIAARIKAQGFPAIVKP